MIILYWHLMYHMRQTAAVEEKDSQKEAWSIFDLLTSQLFIRQLDIMVKQNVFEHFVVLALKGLRSIFFPKFIFE